MDETPAFVTSDGTYTYDCTTPWWNEICSQLPCSMNLAWPGYATQAIPVVLRGEPAVIQTWKGWCQSPPDIPGVAFPGGVGAEVGVYRIDPSRRVPDRISLPPGLPPVIDQFLGQRLADVTKAAVGSGSVWWPAPELVDPDLGVAFRMYDPEFHDPLVDFRTNAYWTCKWMHMVPSCMQWAASWHANHWSWSGWKSLADYNDFVLDFTVNGQDFRWESAFSPIRPLG